MSDPSRPGRLIERLDEAGYYGEIGVVLPFEWKDAVKAIPGGYYYDTAEARHFGLRSADDGADVARIAQEYGGGGHRHASGFKVPRSHPLAQS